MKMKKTPGDIIILHRYTISNNHMMYSSCDNEHDTDFFFFLHHFLLFYPPKNAKNWNFEKNEKIPGDIIILDMCAINKNHMIYSSGDNECNEQNFFSFWTFFLSFHARKNPKNQNFQKIKSTHENIIILHKSIKNHDHMLHCSLFFILG